MDSESRPGKTAETAAEVAAAILADLRAASPDAGDDETQVMLDDVLDGLEGRLVRLVGGTA